MAAIQAITRTQASRTTSVRSARPEPKLNLDSVSLDRTRQQGSARQIPDFRAWYRTAEGLTDRVASAGKKIWDAFSGIVGLGDMPVEKKPAPVDQQPLEAAPEKPKEPAGPTLQGLPPRPEDARTGSQFMDSIGHLKPGPQRDKAVLQEILSGNIPDRSRNLKEVTVNRKGKDGREHELKMYVMPDYLSIGSDQDNVRIPMTPAVAQAIADKTGTSLPTDRIVDDVQARARKLHMAPFTWKPGRAHADNMESLDYYQKHDQRVDDQLGTGEAQTELVSGHKKDLVIPAKDGRVAIYGGRWPGSGDRVQPYSNKHFDIYEDYSHGVRLVSQDVLVDGQKMKLSDLLADPNLAPLVSRFPPGYLNNRYP